MPDDIARAEERCMERLKSKIQVLETSYDFDTARLEEKCERLQKQLDIAKKYLNERADKDKYADWVLLRIEALNEIHKQE